MYPKPSYELIKKATNHNQEAIETIIRLYQPYIFANAKRLCYDFQNRPFYAVDAELQHRIEQKLRKKIPDFKEDYP